jgi:hypothetical protein
MNELYTHLIGYFTTLSNVRVIRANQNAPAPTAPYLTLNIQSVQPTGSFRTAIANDGKQSVTRSYAFTLDVNFYGKKNGQVELEVGISLCPDLRPYVVAYLTAHNVTLSNRGGNAGIVTDIREGQLSVSYEAGGNYKSPYAQTPYGQKYLQLVKQCMGGVAFRTAVMPWA